MTPLDIILAVFLVAILVGVCLAAIYYGVLIGWQCVAYIAGCFLD